MSLVSRLPSLPYTVYFDNFFTSLKLCEELASKGMGSTGTVRANRIENCPLPPMKKEVRGSYDYKRDPKSGLILVRWQDNNVVTVVSTVHGTFPLSKAPRWSRAEKSRVQLDQPFAISQYNKGMGGVDRLDQNVASYRISIRTKKWWWPLFRYMLDVSLQNAWLLYRRSQAQEQNALTQLEFRRSVVRSYFAKHGTERALSAAPRRSRSSTKVPLNVRLDGLHHYQGQLDSIRRCVVCKKNCKKQCLKCEVPLHNKCVIEFHT